MAAQEPVDPSPPPPDPPPAVSLLPGRALYPPYLAEWKNPEFSLGFFRVTDRSVPEAGSGRVSVKLGARFGLLRYTPRGSPDRPWQLEGEVGFWEQADPDHELDDIGWDGGYSLLLCRELRPGWFVQFGSKHASSHVGDEYAERTGRRRVGYTRDEVTLGAARRARSELTAYFETGISYNLRDRAGQRRWRVQSGLQKEWMPPQGGGRTGLFAAINVEMMQELKWQPDMDAQAGAQIRAGDMRWRIGLHFRDGRNPNGEFTRFRESYFMLGAWLIL